MYFLMKALRGATAAAALVAVLTGASCLDASPRNCIVNAYPPWLETGIKVLRIEPRNCPYVVPAASSWIPYSFILEGPSGADYVGLATQLTITNNYGQYIFAPNGGSSVVNYRYFSPYAADALQAGQFVGGSTQGTIRDRADLTSGVPQGYNTETVFAFMYLPGIIGGYADVSGPPTGISGNVFTWTAAGAPGADSLSYQYQWRVNGQDVPGATHSQYLAQFPVPGSYEISVVMTYSDYSTVTPTQTHASVFGVQIAGQTSIEAASSVYLDAVVPGGVAPFTYEWSLDYGGFGAGGSSYEQFFGGTSYPTQHSLDLRVTDAQSNVATATTTIFVGPEGGGGCDQPPCGGGGGLRVRPKTLPQALPKTLRPRAP